MILCGLVYALPPIQSQFSFNFVDAQKTLHDAFFPPDPLTLTAQAITPGTPNPDGVTSTPGGASATTLTPSANTATPAITASPLPGDVGLKGIHYLDQHGQWNLSPSDSLAMALSYWGWTGVFTDLDKYLRPFAEDYNVMPYELADYATNQANLSVITREGGNLDVLKRLVAGGYVVLIEKGVDVKDPATGKTSWMSHYNVVSGYNDSAQEFIVQDSAYPANLGIKYDTLLQQWRPFDDNFLVVYSPDKEKALMSVLGEYADEGSAYRKAYNQATQEANSLNGIDAFFAWFNRGTSQVNLQDYTGAADSYDKAFALYAALPADTQPFRMMWYQTGPYYAYYYMFRYQDVVDLATHTLASANKPYLEESYYWRGRAERALNDNNSDIADQRLALKYHPGFKPSLDELSQLGITK